MRIQKPQRLPNESGDWRQWQLGKLSHGPSHRADQTQREDPSRIVYNVAVPSGASSSTVVQKQSHQKIIWWLGRCC